jgi:hypothetical protein
MFVYNASLLNDEADAESKQFELKAQSEIAPLDRDEGVSRVNSKLVCRRSVRRRKNQKQVIDNRLPSPFPRSHLIVEDHLESVQLVQILDHPVASNLIVSENDTSVCLWTLILKHHPQERTGLIAPPC